MLEEYLNGNVVKITTLLKDLLASGVKPETLSEEIVGFVIDNPRPELFPLLSKLTGVKDPYAEAKLLVALVPEQLERDSLKKEPLRAVSQTVDTTARATEPHDSPADDAQPDIVQKTSGFDWQKLLDKVQGLNEVVYKQLIKSEHEVERGVLKIYPKTKIIKNILDKPNNKRVIDGSAEGLKVEICEAGKHVGLTTKDATLDKISDIMGGEVINDNGGSDPF